MRIRTELAIRIDRLVRRGIVVARRRAGGQRRAVVIEHCALLTACELPLAMTRFGMEVLGLDKFESLRGREGFRACAREQHVLAAFEYAARRQNRIAYTRYAADRAGVERAAVHDGRVEFMRAGRCVDRTAARVEERTIFEQTDGFADGVERAAAVGKHALSGAQHSVQGSVIVGFGAGRHRCAQDRACPAVNGNDCIGVHFLAFVVREVRVEARAGCSLVPAAMVCGSVSHGSTNSVTSAAAFTERFAR